MSGLGVHGMEEQVLAASRMQKSPIRDIKKLQEAGTVSTQSRQKHRAGTGQICSSYLAATMLCFVLCGLNTGDNSPVIRIFTNQQWIEECKNTASEVIWI